MSLSPGASVRLRDVFGVLFDDADGLIELRALPSRDRAFFRPDNLPAIEAWAKPRRASQNLYFGIAPRKDDSSGRGDNCCDLTCVWVDVDFKDVPENEARERIANAPLCPTVVIHSGGGLHVYWKLKEPLPVAEAKPMLRRLALYFGADLQSAEPARVLRLPNSLNLKYTPAPQVKVLMLEGRC